MNTDINAMDTPDVLNIGSINLDHVYQVAHFVQPGETLSADAYSMGLGGKGLNQTVALHRADLRVRHIGAIGQDDPATLPQLQALGLDTQGIAKVSDSTGHALIQVDQQAENCIVIYPGANAAIDSAALEDTLRSTPSPWLLMQNETNATAEVFRLAAKYQRRLAFNPAPAHPDLASLPLASLALLVVNQVELQQLSGHDDYSAGLLALQQRCPQTEIVVTLGSAGALCALPGQTAEQWQHCSIVPVDAKDTTGAGDTFVGYYLASRIREETVASALATASAAAALCVTRLGAVDAIPTYTEVRALQSELG